MMAGCGIPRLSRLWRKCVDDEASSSMNLWEALELDYCKASPEI